MKGAVHRPDTQERVHYIPSKKIELLLHPKLVYAGTLNRSFRWQETPHSHDFLEIIFVKSGSGTVALDGRSYHIARGDLVIYNAGKAHHEKSSPGDPMEIYFFAVQGVKLAGLPENHLIPPEEGNAVIPSGEQREILERYLSSLVRESQNDQHFAREMTESLTRLILILILRLLSLGSGQYVKTNILYLKAKTYIDEYYAVIGSVDEVCKAVYISNYYLNHLFNLYGGTTPLRYITGKKLELAKTLLRTTELPVYDIALRCGYENANYFCKVFKARESITPLQFRTAPR
jgi:AraC-like DNA-binding protein/mannose-6-phosphate isomerase-like protein (cupin superfamily)